LFQVAHDPRCSKSGVYWSWNGGPREGRGAEALEKGGQISGGGGAGGGWDSIFENDQSQKVLDVDTQMLLFYYASQITGAEFPELKQVTSPCPTLKVITAVTKAKTAKEEMKRMRQGRPGFEVEKPVKLTKRKRIAMIADRAVSGVLSNTVGRVGRLVGKRLLGEFPEEAKTGSFHPVGETAAKTAAPEAVHFNEIEESQELLEEVVAPQLSEEPAATTEPVIDSEDEALFQQIYDEEAGKTRSEDQKIGISA